MTICTTGHPVYPLTGRWWHTIPFLSILGIMCGLGQIIVVLPGVTIGDDTVIGAGSIVTRDIPANVVAVGNPCRVMRPISERDRSVRINGES